MKQLKITLLFPLFLTVANASVLPDGVMAYIDAILAALSLLLIILFINNTSTKQKLKEAQETIEEKDEKINWLRRIGAENEHRHTTKIQELEKQIVELNHTIEKLEQRVKEGTKNQVVAKLEALQHKRAKAMEEAGLEA